MAHVGKGLPFVATGKSEALKTATKFRKYISNPVLTNINIEFKGFDVYDVEPLEVPDVFSERPVLVYGKYNGGVFGSIEVTGETGDKDFKWSTDVKKYTRDRSNTALQYLWARERIRILDDYTNLASNDAHVNEITALGLKYNLLTAYTSFIAIDSEVRNQSGNSTTVKQPLPLPEGVSNYAIGTASGAVRSMPKKGRYSNSLNQMTPNTVAYDMEDHEVEMKEESIYSLMESTPEFKGGEKAFKEFLKSNLSYPSSAKEKGIEGTVYVEFIVNEDGTIEAVAVIRSVSKEIDDEAIRLINLTSGKWKPAKQNGKVIKTSMIVLVKFKL